MNVYSPNYYTDKVLVKRRNSRKPPKKRSGMEPTYFSAETSLSLSNPFFSIFIIWSFSMHNFSTSEACMVTHTDTFSFSLSFPFYPGS